MIRRRLAFATPFVLVVGCRTPAAVEPGEDERTKQEEAPVVVALPEPADAGAVDAPDLHLEEAAGIRNVVKNDETGDPNYGPYTCCSNPPPPKLPKPPPEPRPVCCVNPPRPQKASILKLSVEGTKVVIWIATGTNDGVTRDFAVCVPAGGDEDRCEPNGTVTLIRCDKNTCIGTVKLPIDTVKARSFVRVSPP